MATKLTKPVRREIAAENGMTLIIELTPAGIMIKEKGRRTAYGPLSYAALHIRGAQLEAAHRAREKQLERKAKGLPERKPNRRRLAVGI
jgi:hypothetical protein